MARTLVDLSEVHEHPVTAKSTRGLHVDSAVPYSNVPFGMRRWLQQATLLTCSSQTTLPNSSRSVLNSSSGWQDDVNYLPVDERDVDDDGTAKCPLGQRQTGSQILARRPHEL